MGADQILVTTIYFFISLLGFLFWRSISKHYSGDNFTVKSFWICLVGVLLWGRLSLVWRATARYYFFLHPWNFWSITIWFDGLLSLVGFFRGYVFLAKQCATLSLHAF